MPHLNGRYSRWVAVSLVASLFMVGCSEDTTKPDPQPQPHARSTLAGTIEFFAQAHEDENIDAYSECLHPNYRFWFSEDDLEDPTWDWLNWIGLDEDVAVTENMFAAESVTEIRVTLTNLTTGPADSAGFWLGVDPGDGAPFSYYWSQFGVDMHVVETTQETEIDHWVDGRAYICLRTDPQDSTLWTIWKIEDRGNEHKATEECSWSEIKSLFRK